MIRLRLAGLILIASAAQLSAGHELDGRDIAAGQQTYAEHCAACHGANLQGQENWQSPDENGIRPAPPHDANGHTWHHDNQLLFDYTLLGGREALNQRGIQNAPSAMPGFAETLSEEEIWNTLAYIRSTWPERIQNIQQMRNPPHN